MKLMRTVLFFFCIAVVLGCGSASSPKDTVASYLKAVDQLDFEKSRTFLVKGDSLPEWQRNIERAGEAVAQSERAAFIEANGNRKYNIEVTEEQSAHASITAVAQESQIAFPVFFEMTKRDDQWKIENITFAN